MVLPDLFKNGITVAWGPVAQEREERLARVRRGVVVEQRDTSK